MIQLTLISRIVTIVRERAFNLDSFLCHFLRNIGVGRFVFNFRIYSFKIENIFGQFNQREIEYPWILKRLESGKNQILLDVGCGESLLAHELLSRGFSVVGLDVRGHPVKNHREIFVKANAVNTGLPSELFDVITLVSTIEHIGLTGYSQDLIKNEADFLTMHELRRLLKPGGVLVLTTPYEGGGPFRIHMFGKNFSFGERRYDSNRLSKLIEGFKIIDSEFFLCRFNKRCSFVPIDKQHIDQLASDKTEGSLACLILQKEN